MRALRRRQRPVSLGSLERTEPHCDRWGSQRGKPVDRLYIERFLDEHRADITGRVLEVKDSTYTERFGHAVREAAVLDVDPSNEDASVIADLGSEDGIPEARFDCFVLTQTLQLILDAPAALRNAHRLLAPGGVLLLTVPVTSRICDPPLTDYWRFTPAAVERLLENQFGSGNVTVRGYGNVYSQIGFLSGLAVEDLDPRKLHRDDPQLPLIVCARAIRER